jgi:lipopolysaccharide assembly protein A
MRQINFLLVFIFCLALVLFSIENTESATIRLVQGLQVEAPISVELILALGLGAVIAWLFSIWSRLLQQLVSRQKLRSQAVRIQELEKNLEQYKVETTSTQLTLPASTETPT